MPDHSRSQHEQTSGEEPDDNAGFEPVEALALVKRSVKQTEAEARIEKPSPVGPLLLRWHGLAWNAQGNAGHHERRYQDCVPEDPVPGKMLLVPSLHSCGNVAGENDVHRVRAYTEDDEALRKIAQDERQRQGIKCAAG